MIPILRASVPAIIWKLCEIQSSQSRQYAIYVSHSSLALCKLIQSIRIPIYKACINRKLKRFEKPQIEREFIIVQQSNSLFIYLTE